MLVAQVCGHVVATAKHPDLRDSKLLLLRPIAAVGRPAAVMMAVDCVGAGEGERVLVVLEGRSATEAFGRPQAPLDAAIIGIVDRIDPL